MMEEFPYHTKSELGRAFIYLFIYIYTWSHQITVPLCEIMPKWYQEFG